MSRRYTDPVEPDSLRDRLRAAAGAAPHGDETLQALRPRLVRARRRRRLQGAAALGAVALLGFAAVATGGDEPGGERIEQVAPPSSRHDDALASSSSSSSSSITTAPSTTAPPSGEVAPTTASGVETSLSPTTRPLDVSSTTREGEEDDDEHSSTTAAPTAAKTFSCRGGSATVRVSSGQVVVESTAPASGWSAAVNRKGDDDVEIEFRRTSPYDASKLRVRLDDGQLTNSCS